MPQLYDLNIAQAADAIRTGEISSVELSTALLDLIDQLEPSLHAWVTIDREEVLGAAHQRDEEAADGDVLGPLHGVPIGLKDIYYTSGMKTTACSKVLADFVPDHDATSVVRLKQAGAIVLGKAVTTEFATSDPSPTINPWNASRTPGGSSSGSSVAVATRMCAGALGSQTAGSTCRPAAYNGIVGLKGTYGRISRFGVIPVSYSMDTVGILTRTVEDAGIMLEAMAGYDSNDPCSAWEPVDEYREMLNSPVPPPRIGLIREFFLQNCDDETRRHTEEMAQLFASRGADVVEVSLPPNFKTIYAAHRTVTDVECSAYHEDMFNARADDYSPKLRGWIEIGKLIPGVHYLQAQRLRRRHRAEMDALARSVDILLTPSAPSPAPPLDEGTTGSPIFQTPWTTAGLPTISLPSGLSAEGLPLGIQLEGHLFGEGKLLAAARWCERVIGLELMPPVVPTAPRPRM